MCFWLWKLDLLESSSTRDDLGELGGDLGLTHAVELAFEQVGHLAGVVGGGFHRNHAGDVLGDDRIVETLKGDGFDGCGEQVIEERFGVWGKRVDIGEPGDGFVGC